MTNSEGEEKIDYILDMLKLWKERSTVFPNITPKGAYMAKASQLRYDNHKNFRCSLMKIYMLLLILLIRPMQKHLQTLKVCTRIFLLMVGLYDASQKTAQELFSKYDDISEKIDFEVKNYTNKRNAFLDEDGEVRELE